VARTRHLSSAGSACEMIRARQCSCTCSDQPSTACRAFKLRDPWHRTYCRGDWSGSCGLSRSACAKGVRCRKNSLRHQHFRRSHSPLIHAYKQAEGRLTPPHATFATRVSACHAAGRDLNWAILLDTADPETDSRVLRHQPHRYKGQPSGNLPSRSSLSTVKTSEYLSGLMRHWRSLILAITRT
jgi:hypothetical protein